MQKIYQLRKVRSIIDSLGGLGVNAQSIIKATILSKPDGNATSAYYVTNRETLLSE